MPTPSIASSTVVRPPLPQIIADRRPAAQPQRTALQTRGLDTFSRASTTPGTRELAQRLNPEHNPKYLPHGGNTYCNVYTQDFMRARGVNLPQQTANDTNDWLHSSAGRAAGWRQVSASEAQQAVNSGHNALVVSKHNPHGHIAPIVEGNLSNGSPTISNAGSANFNIGPANRSPSFQRPNTEYWVHD